MTSKPTLKSCLGLLFISVLLSFSQYTYAALAQNQSAVQTAYGKGTVMQHMLAISGLTGTTTSITLSLTNSSQISKLTVCSQNYNPGNGADQFGTAVSNPGATVTITGSTAATSLYVYIDIAAGATTGTQVNVVCTSVTGGTSGSPSATTSSKTVLVADNLTGTKSVKASAGDYATIALMTTAINNYGVGANLVFNINDDETFATPSIANAYAMIRQSGTASNPLIIKRSGTGTNKPILTSTATTSNADAVIGIYGADYITIDGLDIRCTVLASGTNPAFERPIYCYGTYFHGCNNNEIKNCRVDAGSITGQVRVSGISIRSNAIVAGSTASSSYNKIHDNTIMNVDAGVDINYNVTAVVQDNNNEIYNNTITGQFATEAGGIRIGYCKDTKIYNNSLDGTGYTTVPASGVYRYGIATTSNTCTGYIYCYNNVVKNLTVNVNSTNGVVGISLIANTVRIYNNVVANLTNISTTLSSSLYRVYGILGSTDNTLNPYYDICHNSVYLKQTTAVTSGTGVYISAAVANDGGLGLTGINLINNVLVNESTVGTIYSFSLPNRPKNYIVSTSDNNLYYPANFSVSGAGTLNTLALYKIALASQGAEQNSISSVPSFVSSSDLHIIDNSSLANNGGKVVVSSVLPALSITSDIEGVTRSSTKPDMGAYEFGLSIPSVSSLSGLSYTIGNGPSAEKSFNIYGNAMTDDLLITPTANIEISTSAGSGFASAPITLFKDGSGSIPVTTIYARLIAGLSVGTYNTESISLSSAAELTKTISLSGNVDLGTAVNPASQNAVIVYSSNQTITASGLQSGQLMEVYNTLGEKIKTVIAHSGNNQIEMNTKGLYIIKVGQFNQKLIIK